MELASRGGLAGDGAVVIKVVRGFDALGVTFEFECGRVVMTDQVDVGFGGDLFFGAHHPVDAIDEQTAVALVEEIL